MNFKQKIIIPFVVILLNSFLLHAQTITTFAGGYGPATGDGGLATSAHLSEPYKGSFDAAGNYYFGQANPRVRMVNTSGIIYTAAGNGTTGFSGDSGPATAADLSATFFPIVDATGNIFISDWHNYRVRKVDASTGIINTIAGTGVSGITGDGGPASVATITPQDICLDRYGNLYIIDSNAKIRKIDTSGIITTIAGTGVYGYTGDGGEATATAINADFGICVDAHNNLYFGCVTWIRKIDLNTGIINTIAGTGLGAYITDGVPATSTNIRCYGLGLDAAGNLYMSDDGNNRIRMIDAAGIIHTVAGNGTAGFSGDGMSATAAEIHGPEGVVFDECGNMYIADAANNRIRKVTYPFAPVLSISAMPKDTVCAGTPVTFNAVAAGGGNVTSYQWSVNSTVIPGATGAAYTFTPASGDVVSYTLTGSNCSGFAPASSPALTMVVNPTTTPTISLAGITTAHAGVTVTVTATVAGTGGSYNIHWFKNGALFATTTTPTVTYTKAAGVDTITATIVPTSAGCYDSTTSAGHIVSTPLGIGMLSSAQLNIYPNPAYGQLHIDGLQTAATYKLTDIVGETVGQGVLNTGNNSVSIKQLPSGVYVLELTTAGERVITRVVKE